MPAAPDDFLTGSAFPWSFAALDGDDADFARAAVAILPAPYDGTVSYRPGARDGPRAIIEASRYLELYEPDIDDEPSRWGIATLPALEPDASGPEANVARVEQAVGALADVGKLPVMLGGEHTLTIGAVRALARRYPGLSVLQLDAHADMRDSYQGSGYSHACTMRRVREVTDVGTVAQAGVRSISREEIDYIRAAGVQGVNIYTPGAYRDPHAIDELLASLGDTVYVTIDLDALDPSIMPAVGTPEPGGLSWQEAIDIARAVSQRSRIVGFDIMELAPDEGPAHAAFTAARLAYKIIGYAQPAPNTNA